jgi:hypothetical protein
MFQEIQPKNTWNDCKLKKNTKSKDCCTKSAVENTIFMTGQEIQPGWKIVVFPNVQ